jgi:hypothetical protein
MSLQETASLNMKGRELRRSARVNSHVPVALEWMDQLKGRLSGKGKTRVVNFYGCLVLSPQELSIGQALRLTNLVNDRDLEAKVVWKGASTTDGWELGIELANPDSDYWGLDT